MTLGTRIVVVIAPLTNVTWLAATAVCDLTLSCLHTHCLKGAARRSGGALGAVMAFYTLTERRVGHRVEAGQADVASHAHVYPLTGSAVHLVGAVDARLDSCGRVLELVCA